MKFYPLLVLVIAAVFCENIQAESDSFNINFWNIGKPSDSVWDDPATHDTLKLSPDQTAGAGIYNIAVWQNIEFSSPFNTSLGPVTVTSTKGFLATLNIINRRNGSPYNWNDVRDDTDVVNVGNATLLDAHCTGTEDPYDATKTCIMEVTDIPFDSYDLVIYLGINSGQKYQGNGTIILNDGTAQAFKTFTSEPDGTLVEIVDSTTPGNYIVFKNLSNSSCKVEIFGEGFTHLGPAGFQIYTADVTGQLPEDEIITALSELKQHVEGTITLTSDQIASHKAAVDADKLFLQTSENAMTAAMTLIETYDSVIGPLWVDGVKRWTNWDRRLATDDNIHWVIYHVMQYIMDYTYTEENLASYEAILGSFKFGSADNFPGHVDPPADPDAVYTVTINGSFPKTFGHHTMHWENRPARKCTGAYLAPGTVATVTVPLSMVNAGYQIRVGAHALDLSNKPFYLRLGRSSLAYDITSTQTNVTNPLGGGIYIEIPYLADAGVVDIQIKNTVRGPYYSYNTVTGHITSLSEWQNTERNHLAPWADFQSEKFMMQVPTSWIYNHDDPVTVMADWDRAMDACNDLMGFDHDRGKESSYDQVDVLIDAGAYSPGYPTCNNTYNPLGNYNGNVGHYLVRGPQYAPSMHFHEIGHGYLFQKFAGEVESVVNLLHVPVWHMKFGYDLDTAFRASRGLNSNEFVTLDTTAICWMMCQNFKNNQEMTKLEKQYQLKGHARFVEIARQFGWDVLGDYWRSFNEDYENGTSWAQDDDSLQVRLSKAVGIDIRPLFHFWGVHPINASALASAIEAEGLPASSKIYDILVKYKSLIPADNTNYQAFAYSWWGRRPSQDGYTTEYDHSLLWDTYDEDYAVIIRDNVQNIIDLYFPEGRPGLSIGNNKITWSGQTVQMNPVFNGGYSPTTFTWTAEPSEGVVFTPDTAVQNPAITVTKLTSNPSVVTVKLITDSGPGEDEALITLDVYDDPCKAAIGTGLSADHPTDIDGNCLTDLKDFAILAADWLNDGTLNQPLKKSHN